MSPRRVAWGSAPGLAIACSPLAAHSGERALVLLLPTGWYVLGGTLVVALSFVLVAVAPRVALRALDRVWHSGRRPPRWCGDVASIAMLALVLALVVAGFIGSRDPLDNPLPLAVWSLWWVGLTFAHALLGNLWAWLNPWRGIYRLLCALPGLRRWRGQPPLALPGWLGAWPACVALLAFAWVELVYPAPRDPQRLALLVLAYLGWTLLAMIACGERQWRERGEAFAVFFALVARLAPFGAGRDAATTVRWELRLPGARLLELGALDVSRAGFVLVALATVSFDGLSRTFAWLALVGANPLEYPGRSALTAVNSLGLVALAVLVGGACALAISLGRWLAGARQAGAFGAQVGAIVPIAFGYHFAHYLPGLLVDAQYALRALSDPFDRGWDLLGVSGMQVHAALLNDAARVHLVWSVQVGAIVAAHVVAVVLAHAIALRDGLDARAAARAQLPMVALMIGYTWFGLWLLSAPAGA